MSGAGQPDVGTKARLLAGILVIGSGASLILGSAFVISLFDEVGELGALFLRLLFAALMLALLWRPAVRGLSRRSWRYAAAFGLSAIVLNLGFFFAIARAPLGIVYGIGFMGPLAVAIAGSRRPIDLLWVGIAAAGVFLFTPLGGGSLDALAFGLSLVMAVGWAGYIIWAARIGQAFSGGDGIALAMAIGALAMAPAGLISGGSELLQLDVLALGAAVAVLSTVIPYTLEVEALRRLDTGTFGVLVSLQPAVAAVIGLVVLDQNLSGGEIVAIALVVVASVGALGRARAPTAIEA